MTDKTVETLGAICYVLGHLHMNYGYTSIEQLMVIKFSFSECSIEYLQKLKPFESV